MVFIQVAKIMILSSENPNQGHKRVDEEFRSENQHGLEEYKPKRK